MKELALYAVLKHKTEKKYYAEKANDLVKRPDKMDILKEFERDSARIVPAENPDEAIKVYQVKFDFN